MFEMLCTIQRQALAAISQQALDVCPFEDLQLAAATCLNPSGHERMRCKKLSCFFATLEGPGAQGEAYCSRTVARIFFATGGLGAARLVHL